MLLEIFTVTLVSSLLVAGIGLQQNLSLSQALSPQMQQSLHLLQAPVLELQSLIQQELVSNPVLEENQEKPEERNDSDEDWDREVEQLRQQEEDWREYFSQSRTNYGESKEAQEKRQFLFDSQVEHTTLADHLTSQLGLYQLSKEVYRAGIEVIGNIDEDGFLQASTEEMAIAAQVSPENIVSATELIRTFDPPGVGAKDLNQALQIQLEQRGMPGSLEVDIVRDSLNELARKRYTEIARKYKVGQDRVQEAAHLISTLQPKPGARFAPDQPQNVVQAEAAFVKSNGQWVVQLNDESVPRLRISNTYKDLLGQTGKDNNVKDYLKERIRAAKFLIKCLHQRQQTIHDILMEIAHKQEGFLEEGISALKPLTMAQVAEVVGVHETTVSRAIANKYVSTPHGVLPIKYFFTSGYQTAEGTAMANTTVKEAISELIQREDKFKPLSDSDIVEILDEKGIKLARRTVAKYRGELNILPSNLRRER